MNVSTVITVNDEGTSGLDLLQYAWSQSNTTEPTTWSNFTNAGTVSGNLAGGNNYLWLNVTDKAGNRASKHVSSVFEVRYQIKYNSNGGSTVTEEQTKKHDVDLTLITAEPTRNGYTFLGWSTTANATSAQYQSGGKYSDNVARILYAVWSANNYTITYNLNGGTVGTANRTNYTIETESFTLNNPTKTGYTFIGWTGSNGTTPQASVTIAKGNTGNKTYTANYMTATNPSDVAVKQGTAVTFSVTGTNVSTYQWYKSTSQTGEGTAISGATSSSYTIAADNVTSAINDTYYYCIVKNNANSTATYRTASAKLTVYYPPTVTGANNVAIPDGGTAKFSVNVSGGNPSTYTYQWYKSSGGTNTEISGATSSSYSLTATVDLNGTGYYCVVNNGQFSVTSSTGKLTSAKLTGGETKYIKVGNSITLSPTKSGGAGTINWTTSDSTNAKLSTTSGNSVTVTAGNTAGNYTVKATDSVTGASTTYTIKVVNLIVDPTQVTLDLSGTTTQQLTVTKQGEVGAITYESDNTEIATVDTNGLITAIANGTATITISEPNGGITLTCAVTVQTSPTAIELSETEKYLGIENNTVQLSVIYTPSTANVNKEITWTTSSGAIATVDTNGLVTAVAEGECTITATTKNGKTASCKIIVDQVRPIWTITEKES